MSGMAVKENGSVFYFSCFSLILRNVVVPDKMIILNAQSLNYKKLKNIIHHSFIRHQLTRTQTFVNYL